MIELRETTVKFSEKIILDQLNYTFHEGTITGLVAPNGTGKSTLLNAIMNNLSLNNGNVYFTENLKTYQTARDEMEIHKLVTLMPDQSELYDYLSGEEHLKIYQKMWSKTSVDPKQVIDSLEMNHYIKQKAGKYSLGMRQRLCFAMQMVANTPYMLLDEPMNGLDPSNVELISQYLLKKKEEGKVLVISSHLLTNLEKYADVVLFLKDGKFIFELRKDSPREKVIRLDQKQFQSFSLEVVKGEQIRFLSNGTCIIEPRSSEELQEICHQLLSQQIEYFDVGHLSLEDLYAIYFKNN